MCGPCVGVYVGSAYVRRGSVPHVRMCVRKRVRIMRVCAMQKSGMFRVCARASNSSLREIHFGFRFETFYILYNTHDLHVSYIFTKNDVNIPPLYALDTLSTISKSTCSRAGVLKTPCDRRLQEIFLTILFFARVITALDFVIFYL